MKYRKFTKYEAKEVRKEQLANAMHGEGLYLFKNSLNAELTLPRPTKSGKRTVGPKQEFQGDNYYMQLVQQGHLRLIKVLQTPEQERQIMEQKLILDQPDTVTTKGKVEHVVDEETPKAKLNEADNQPDSDVLLNEGPVDGGFVILDE